MTKEFDYDYKFLVVDDYPPMCQAICRNLSKIGFKSTYAASNGREAISYLKAHKVDCIISDWYMPKISGIDLLRFVRDSDEHSHIPFMMITSESDKKMVTAAIAEGVSDFLVKPFTPKMLFQKLRQMLLEDSRPSTSNKAKDPTHSNSESPDDLSQWMKIETRNKQQPLVLVVDDAADEIKIVANAIGDLYSVSAATSGEMAMKQARKQLPDLILLDVMMPGLDGIDVCKQLKLDPMTQDIPVIFITARTEIDDITSGFQAGAVDYVTKPINSDVLRERVKTHVSLKRSRDELKLQVQTLMDNAKLREDIELMTRHDLKMPLSAMINISEELHDSEWVGAKHKPQIETMKAATLDMIQMVNRSLDLYKMETGSYQLQSSKINLSDVLRKVINEARVIANTEKMIIEYEAPKVCFVKGEELLFFSLFSNLINNAVEAQGWEDTVRVKLSVDAGQAVVKIFNSALIPEEIQDNLFDKYVTADKEGGTGLGTYSAKLITETLGGMIDFSSFPHEGTEFRVVLSVYDEPPE